MIFAVFHHDGNLWLVYIEAIMNGLPTILSDNLSHHPPMQFEEGQLCIHLAISRSWLISDKHCLWKTFRGLNRPIYKIRALHKLPNLIG